MARNYAALPHDYAVEMEVLNDAEFGRLCRALLEYSKTGEEVQLKGNEKFLWNRVKMQEQRFQASYEELSELRSEAGRKGAEKRWSKQSGVANGKHGNTETETKYKTDFKEEEQAHDGAISPVLEYYRDKIGAKPSNQCRQLLNVYAKTMGEETVCIAIDTAIDHDAPKWSYIKKVLENWQKAGVTCREEAELQMQDYHSRTAQAQNRNKPTAKEQEQDELLRIMRGKL